MAAATPTEVLVPVTANDVDRWLREAWPRRQDYPDETRCQTLATWINVIVHRGNASPKRRHSKAAIEQRRSDFLAAKKRARALRRALAPVRKYQQSLADMLKPLRVPWELGPESEGAVAIEELHCAVEAFIAVPVHPVVDHQDPVLWIAEVASQTWLGLEKADTGKPRRAVPLGKKPTSPLVTFTRQVLEAIRWKPLPTSETVSEHLRGRHNRPRDRGKVRGEGA
jgi:hypothetical protein